jgi:hypothetical protein
MQQKSPVISGLFFGAKYRRQAVRSVAHKRQAAGGKTKKPTARRLKGAGDDAAPSCN